MPLYQRIKDLREDADKTQAEIAAHLGTTAQYYGKYEKGERELPFSRAIELAEYYGVCLDYLAGRSDYKTAANPALPNNEEQALLEQYRNLTERNKGKAELFIYQLITSQEDQKRKITTDT